MIAEDSFTPKRRRGQPLHMIERATAPRTERAAGSIARRAAVKIGSTTARHELLSAQRRGLPQQALFGTHLPAELADEIYVSPSYITVCSKGVT
jgi:hypothetical protein